MKLSLLALTALPLLLAVTGCTPTVKVEAPDKPIEINMNVRIDHEVRVRVEKDLENEISNHPDLFGVQ